MIETRKELKEFLDRDRINYESVVFSFSKSFRYIVGRIASTPISDQHVIWAYIRTLRMCEYHLNQKKKWHQLFYFYYLHKLRRLSYKTGFQIDPNCIGKGLTIWHWGCVIINGKTRIGDNCVIRPNILIGHKDDEGKAPVIGSNVVINSGARIIGDIRIGDDVIIAPNAVVVKDVPDHSIVAGIPAKIIKTRDSINATWVRVK